MLDIRVVSAIVSENHPQVLILFICCENVVAESEIDVVVFSFLGEEDRSRFWLRNFEAPFLGPILNFL